MTDRIKCGVLGAGWWATFAHIPALLSHPRAELLAIQTNDRDSASKVSADFGIPYSFTDAAELLSLEGLQAVIVSSSPYLHYEQAAAALRAGKHVLIEKPMTLTTSEARHLVELANERDLRFLISCPWHYTPHAADAQQLIAQGGLGKLRMISVLMTNPIGHLLRGESSVPTHGTPYLHPDIKTYSNPEVAGGGQIYAQVCHVAAYLTFLTGVGASEVFARFHNDGSPLDIYDALDLRMQDDTIVTIASTGATSNNIRTYEARIFGTDGMLYLDLWRGKMQHVRMTGTQHVYPDLAPEEIYPHKAPAMNLIDSIFDPSCVQSPATLGVAAMEIIESACISARSGQNILVRSLAEQQA